MNCRRNPVGLLKVRNGLIKDVKQSSTLREKEQMSSLNDVRFNRASCGGESDSCSNLEEGPCRTAEGFTDLAAVLSTSCQTKQHFL